MAQKRQTPLTKDEKISLTLKAQHSSRLQTLAKHVDDNLAMKPTESWRTLTVEHKEIVLFRLSGGDTVAEVCRELGISKGVVYMARHLDPEFKKEYHLARKAGADALADMIREVSRDTTLSDSAKKIELDALKWLASRYNRDEYSDHVRVDQNVAVSVSMPQWGLGGPVIDGSVIEDSEQDD
jgi:transposase-like protein